VGRPLLMIPGPVEVSPAVQAAASAPPPSHTAPELIESFGRSLERMRRVWRADGSAQPFVLAGGGTAAMDMAVANLIEPGDRVLVVHTGYFSDRFAEMLRRAGARVHEVGAPVGDAPTPERVAEELEGQLREGPLKAVTVTHVDTSTGVRVDPEPLARLAREAGALSIFDGVCATGGERFEMAAWDADVYLTASQKALGLPPGLALLVASERALAARRERRTAPPMYLDWETWLPIHRAYEERRPSYFSTPATPLVKALEVALAEILTQGVEARWEAHRRSARALRAGWRALGLRAVPEREELLADTLSALRFPDGTDRSLVGRIGDHGVTVAGGLHPEIRDRYFRVGHMGFATTRPDMLLRTVEAVGRGLSDAGIGVDPTAASRAVQNALGERPE
jgi:alanine-glyoxylate transaminase/serine-glyoxylate transaminase/serine-pyruvate transaminase